ncbi:WD40 repeat-like protein [Suillus brevipes Sb2]|nr:WD40 repeat-like protein [Suillus brevipes Sb2]
MPSITTKAPTAKSSLAPSMTLKGHGDLIRSVSYFPDGHRMISGSQDMTARQWDLKEGKEVEEGRDVCEEWVLAVAVSSDSRWVVTGGGDWEVPYSVHAELKVCEVETGTMRKLQGHSLKINCIDISANNTLLASGSDDRTARIWNLDTGKLVAGPFKSNHWVGAVRFSTDSKKLAVKSWTGMLEVWDIQSQKLVKWIGDESDGGLCPTAPIFWTNNNKNILATFRFTDDAAKTIYEFDVSTLEIVGTPFEGHTMHATGLALSFDGTLLVSSSRDDTIKLWAFESRQLLASFHVQNPSNLILSPDSRKLAYTTFTIVLPPVTVSPGTDYTTTYKDHEICICDTPPDILAQARSIARKKRIQSDLLNSDATRRPTAGRRRPPIHAIPMVQRPPPTIHPRQPIFLRLSKRLRFFRTNTLWPGRNDQSCDLLDVPATLPLPSSLSGQVTTQFTHFEIGSPPPRSNRVAQSLRQHLSFFAPKHSLTPPVVEVAPGRKVTRLVAFKLPEYKKVDDTRHPSSQQATVPQENDTSDSDSLPDVHWCKAFLCFCSCWSHGRLRMPPRWRLERVDIPRQDGTTNGSRSGVNGRS